MIHVKIIRHSERLDYKNPLYWLLCLGQYWADSPLTINGHRVAQEKGKTLVAEDYKPKYIYTSPYNRTMATATEIKSSFPQSEIIIEPLLSEYQPNYKHAINLYPNGIPTTYNGESTEFTYPETSEQFAKRVHFILFRLMDRGHDLCIITHGELLKFFINYLQTIYPISLIDSNYVPYLSILSFNYNKDTKRIDEQSIKLE